MAEADKSGEDFREKDLKERFDFIQKVADLSPNILFVIDLREERITFISKKVQELLGYEVSYILDQNSDIFRMLIHPEDYEERMASLDNCRSLTGEEECEVEVRFRAPQSQWEWYRIREKIFQQDGEGNITHVLGIAQNIHEQKLAEEKLREEHRRLEHAQQIGHIGSFERKLPGDTMHCSLEFYNIFGIEPRKEGLTIQEFYSFVHPDDIENLDKAINKTHATGKPHDTITRIIRPDGSLRHIHRRAGINKDEEGIPISVYGTVQDITERVKAEKERIRTEQLMRSTEILAGMGSYEVLLDTQTVYFSDGLYRIFGEEPGSFAPTLEWIDQHSHPDDVPAVQEVIDRAIAGKTAYTYTRRIYRKDGSLRIMEAHGRLITNKQGNISKIIGLVQDITERKRAEQELRRSENRSRKLLEVLQNAPDAYLVLTPDFHIEMASDAYLRATETTREEIIGKYLFFVFPDNPSSPEASGVENLRTSLKEVLTTKKAHRMPIQNYYVPGPNGNFIQKYWSPTNSPVLNSEGEVEYIIHRVFDVTEVLKEKATIEGLASETEMLKTSLEEIKIQASQIRESRSLLQSVFDASPNSIILYKTVNDPTGKPEDFEFFMVNEFNYNVLGLPRNLKGKKFSEVFPNVHRTGVLAQYRNTAETGEPADFEVFYDGEGFQNWFHFRVIKLNHLLLATAEDITERKKGEQELIQLKEELAQHATDKYKKIINSMDEGFCLIEIIRDPSGACTDYRYVETNPVFEFQTGLKDVIGKTVNETVPDLEPFWKETYGNVASTGESIHFEDYAEPMGRWFDVNAFRIDAPDEQHVAIIFKDITDRKEAEERTSFLLELNDAIRPLEDAAKIQETAMQILGTHLEVNRAYFSKVLEDEDTLAGRKGYYKNIEPITSEVKISDFSKELQKQLCEGKEMVVQDLMKAYEKDEKATHQINNYMVRAIIAVPLLKNKKLAAIVTIQQKNPRLWTDQEVALVKEVADHTWAAMERAEAERAMRESEQRFRNLVEASALAVWETEPDGMVLNESMSWRNFTGQSNKETLGEGWLNAIHPEDRTRVKKQWKQAVADLKNFDSEFRLLSASGKAIWTNVKAIPILDTEGKVYKWSGMNLDIHDRKQAEEALIQAIEEVEAASRAKEDFLSTMSHEIRTPLNAVIGLTNLLLDRNPREDQKENLNSLSFSAKNLLALINNILDFSKLEAGKATHHITDFDLPLLLINLKQAHHPMAIDKQTKLDLHIDDKIPARIATDQLKLSQVLHNLVSNAVKFTESGKVNISVELQKQENETLWLKFDIEDTGIGISEDKIEHIFEKFTQAESSTVRQYGGTGLGLSITRLLLELMGSEIKLESTPGKGSRFYFSLPVKKAKNEVFPVSLETKTGNPENLQNLKILLVEDVEINRRIILQFLQNWWQIKPDEAKNGKEAVELAMANQYDLILMDIRMPVMDGYEATYRISKLPGYQNIPVLALTADKNQEVQQADHETRFSGLLTKPFEPLDLKKKILLHLPFSFQNSNGKSSNGEFSTSETTSNQEVHVEDELLPLVLSQLKEYKNAFSKGVLEADLQQLKDLRHKSIVLLEMFHFKELSEKLKKAVESFTEGADKENPELIILDVNVVFDRAIKRIADEIREPSLDITRYTTIAGKNIEVLQKLISNSVRTLEIYKEEFIAAAGDQDADELSNLVHKNTTSLHYLQANRLKREIEEFRGLLKIEPIPEQDLQAKQKEIQTEFEFVTARLKALEYS
ncbi:PAS domain S-box-containing protein [Salinimicrobium sediminis]|uniref:histidine kinase n=1 Tax=Salinimicrobium sediminis TaxID=1343891 RepID=A0A285X6T2_9FLAO|nr:PAS domain S-box protein [Salinimicrobium sediminis]SOC81053.1 PAS domain S-box-containing protein [Salinimicrobium sediminis]